MTKTIFHNNIKGYVEFAKTFESNRDMGTGGRDKGIDKAAKAVEGWYKFRFYPQDQETLDKMVSVLGKEMFGGHERFKEGTSDLGVGLYMTFKRPHKHPSGYDNLGGAPKILRRPTEEEAKDMENPNRGVEWNVETDGFLGNGTAVTLTYTTYGEGTSISVSPVELKIRELVKFEPNQESQWD